MELQEEIVGPVVVLRITGDITLKSHPKVPLPEIAKGLLQRGYARVLLDLGGVSFVDSAGLGELVQSHALLKNAGGSLSLCSVTRRLADLLTMTRLNTMLTLYESESAALASLGAR